MSRKSIISKQAGRIRDLQVTAARRQNGRGHITERGRSYRDEQLVASLSCPASTGNLLGRGVDEARRAFAHG